MSALRSTRNWDKDGSFRVGGKVLVAALGSSAADSRAARGRSCGVNISKDKRQGEVGTTPRMPTDRAHVCGEERAGKEQSALATVNHDEDQLPVTAFIGDELLAK